VDNGQDHCRLQGDAQPDDANPIVIRVDSFDPVAID